MKSWVGVFSLLISTAICSFGYAEAAMPSLQTTLTSTLGTALDATQAATSVTFEPDLNYRWNDEQSVRAYASLERPTNAYKNFSMPLSFVQYRHRLLKNEDWELSLRPRASLMSLDRWSSDGVMVRSTLGLYAKYSFTDSLSVVLAVAPYVQFSEYRQTTSGETLPRHGISERATFAWTTGRTTLELDFLIEQKRHTDWKNNYVLAQSLSYDLDGTFSVGASHELATSVIDESTGRGRSFSFFDSRRSRVSAFVEVIL